MIFGIIEIVEQTYRCRGKQVRPFCESAGVKCRGYSMKVQRESVDFAADQSYEKSGRKMREHYGIEVPISAIKEMTERHGAAMAEARDLAMESKLPKGGASTVIGEMDGSMVPIVTIKPMENAESPQDGRKRRALSWQEARLCLGRDLDKVDGHYAATMESVEEATDLLVDCLIKAGAGRSTKLHLMGDGAQWIANRTMGRFEGQATFLLDFYHLSEYISDAADVIAPEHKQTWFRQQQERAKENQIDKVIDELLAHCESHDIATCRRSYGPGDREECPASSCKRYIENRLEYLDYQSAIQFGLPIGTGEVEGGHGSVIQDRIKQTGAWWLVDNANKMLALRTIRENGQWESYWEDFRQQAA
jgi:hypothetical protein